MNSQTKTLRFEAIPVMDLMGGKVVRAKRGERHAYQPIESRLCNTSEPIAIAEALLQLYPFTSLYIADLDAIQGRGQHLQTATAIRRAFPGLEIWIDAGVFQLEQCQPWLDLGARCVIGSESQRDLEHAARLMEQIGEQHTVLSLDYKNNLPQGPADLFENSVYWPARVISMTLGRVGSYEGPDMGTLQRLQKLGADRQIYAAGGVRDSSDLEQLAGIKVNGALIASALHDGKITADQLRRLAQ